MRAHTVSPNFTRVADLTQQELRELLDLASIDEGDARSLGGRASRRGDRLHLREAVDTDAGVVRGGDCTARSDADHALDAGAAARPRRIDRRHGSLALRIRHAIVIRTFAQETVDELARWATVPVVNALSDEHHPCQALADLLTIEEAFGDVAGRRLAFVGDGGDNVAHSLLEVAALAGVDLTIACPPEFTPDPRVFANAHASRSSDSGAELTVVHDPPLAVAGADAVYADVWASMGEEWERDVTGEGARPVPGDRAADGARKARARSSSTACRPSAGKRWRPRSSTGRSRSSGSSRRTECRPRKRSSRC